MLAGLAAGSVIGGSPPASAATAVSLYVSAGGTGDCATQATACGSIQTAINTAENGTYNTDDVTINVAVSPTAYTENDVIDASGLVSLTIAGAGASTTTVNGGGVTSVFFISGSTPVTMSGLTVTNGAGFVITTENGTQAVGGGITLSRATLTIDDAVVSGNSAPGGGGAAFKTMAG